MSFKKQMSLINSKDKNTYLKLQVKKYIYKKKVKSSQNNYTSIYIKELISAKDKSIHKG